MLINKPVTPQLSAVKRDVFVSSPVTAMKHRAAMPYPATVVCTKVIRQMISVPAGCMPRMRQTRTGQGNTSHITNNGSNTTKNDILRGLGPMLHTPALRCPYTKNHGENCRFEAP